MKTFKVTVMSIVFFVISAYLFSVYAAKYVEVKEPFISVYEYLDPKSNVIIQAKKGDRYELVYEGKAWYQIKVKDKVGWLEKRAGVVVDTAKYLPIGTFIVFVILLLGTLIAVSMYIYKQKTVEI